MPIDDLIAIRRLQGLMDITNLVSGEEAIPSLLDEVARVLAQTVGFAGVAINVYRPQWDDFQVTTVVGAPEMHATLMGETYDRAAWLPIVCNEQFARRGAYFIADGAFDWETGVGARYTPERDGRSDPDAWCPGDELFVPCRDSAGHTLAVLSLGEPVSGRRPSDAELDFLVAVGASAACALEHAGRALDAARHRAALEELLAVSSKLASQDSIEPILEAVCGGVRRALGFAKVVIELTDPATGSLVPRASIGWPHDERPDWEEPAAALASLLDPAFEIGGCYLLSADAARERVPLGYHHDVSRRNGRGPLAWDDHWLYVPLRDRAGQVVGRIWADDPEDRLLPTRARLEALAVFANQATMAIVAAGQLEELRALAEEDSLTGLCNRRAFTRELDRELERTRRHGRSVALVLCDVDRFKQINDTHGHPAGDRALCEVAAFLRACLRAGDAAYRIGGDEFALLLPETTAEQAAAVAARVTHGACEGGEPVVGVSCGVAAAPGDGADREALIVTADAALYAAKLALRA
jgi:diguanylate cyclase (GGDEF)-like protein